MMTDPIADMLTRIRNAALAHHDRTEMPHSQLKEHLAAVLKSEGYVDDVRVSEGDERKTLTLVARYADAGYPEALAAARHAGLDLPSHPRPRG